MSNTVPNLDCMSKEELGAFWSKHRGQSRKAAAALIGDTRKGYCALANKLANYAINKSTALSCRLSGEIQAAQSYETVCDRLYSELPEDLRW